MEKLVLIDGHSILNRAFYGVPNLTNSEGLHTNAVYGFLNILFKLLEEEKPQYLAVAFDLKAPTFRHIMYDDYKGTRKPMPQELHEQVPLMKEALCAMGIPILTKEGYEADDVLGTAAKHAQADGYEVTIVSGDRDLLQLSDTHIKISIPKTSRGTTEVHNYYPEDVVREYQVTPQQFIDVKALMGDTSDNIPGVPSVGEKTATNLILQFGSVAGVYEHLDEVKPPRAKKSLEENRELADISYKLAKICIEAPIDFEPKDAMIGDLYTKEAYEFMSRMEFKSMLAKFGAHVKEEEAKQHVFSIVTDLIEAGSLFEKAKKADHVGAQLLIDQGTVSGMALCFDEESSYVLPAVGFLTAEYLAEQMEMLCKNGNVWVLDLKSQLPFMKLSYETLVYDAGVAAYLLNPLKDSYDYDDLARDYLGLTVPGKTELLKKMTFASAWEQDEKAFQTCAGYIGHVAYMVGKPLIEKLEAEEMKELYLSMELPLIYALYHMEEEGIAVRKEELKAYGEKLKEKIVVLEREIWDMTGCEFNINSPKQLGEILFEKMQIKGGKKTKTGYSTAADVLEKLAPDYPVIRKILEYRQYTKLNSTYAEGLGAYIGPDGRIHSKFNQTITATGRLSSTEPNLQNIPVRMELGREIRKVFVPKEGYVFLDADYSQIELRVLAHMSDDERLIEAYKSAQDIHAITASQVFHVPLEEVTPLIRRNAKAVNFGIVYGISAFGLSEDLSISRKEALDYINRYFETYPQVKAFLDGLIVEAKENGFVKTMFHRRRPVPELKSANFMQRSFGERVAMNSPIQGTAADIIKIAMIRVDKRLREEGLQSRLILQVHDELLIETFIPELEAVKKILAEEMSQAVQMKVDLEIDMHEGNNWFEAK
ncbi:MAG: DNA polymerase I [Lachnoclostridium sp.]|nr:DNA polymerase I [Lachnoclostridium sp.]